MKETDMNEIEKRVYHHFKSGFHCSEVVLKTILDMYDDASHENLIRLASAFGGGIGGSMEDHCGAFTGGVLSTGFFLGRENPGEELSKSKMMISEFKEKFIDTFGHLNCAALRKSFGDEGQMGCVRVTMEATKMMATLLDEYEVGKPDSSEISTIEPYVKVNSGACPFSGGCSSDGCSN